MVIFGYFNIPSILNWGIPYVVRGKKGAWTAFTRKIVDDLNIYRFKTDKIFVFPGTTVTTKENGYILLSQNGRQMSLYQLWSDVQTLPKPSSHIE